MVLRIPRSTRSTPVVTVLLDRYIWKRGKGGDWMRLDKTTLGSLWRYPFWFVAGCDASYEMQGPSFVTEPQSRVEFTNVNGGRVDCIVRGNPAPTVDWLAADGGSITSIPGIRHVLGNGTIHFPGFEAEVFRQDVHWAIYKCFAVNSVGAIVSRDVTVRAGTRNFFLVICIMLSARFASSSISLPLLSLSLLANALSPSLVWRCSRSIRTRRLARRKIAIKIRLPTLC